MPFRLKAQFISSREQRELKRINRRIGRGPGLPTSSKEVTLPLPTKAQLQAVADYAVEFLSELLEKEAVDSGHATILDPLISELLASYYADIQEAYLTGLRMISERESQLIYRHRLAVGASERARNVAAVENDQADTIFKYVFGFDRRGEFERVTEFPSPADFGSVEEARRPAELRGRPGTPSGNDNHNQRSVL